LSLRIRIESYLLSIDAKSIAFDDLS